MSIFSGRDSAFEQNSRVVKQALKKSGRPLDQDQISRKTNLDPEETREIVMKLVDRGELKSTLGWKYALADE